MIEIYYTGANTQLGVQQDSNLSLGGYVSNTPLQNDIIGNMFSDISYQDTLKIPVKETKAIAIYNAGTTKIRWKIGYKYPENSIFKIEIAVVTIDQSTKSMEKIVDSRATPFYATFQEANIDTTQNIDNSIVIDSIDPAEYFGIWIRRTILSSPTNIVVCPAPIYPSITPQQI